MNYGIQHQQVLIIMESLLKTWKLVEAVTDENYSLRYKLLTLPKNTIRIPIIQSNPSSISLEEGSKQQVVTLETKNGGNETHLVILLHY